MSAINDAARAARPERVPLHEQKKLSADKREGFVRRWVNDIPGRVNKLMLAGYTKVTGVAERVVDKALGIKAVLLETPEEFYHEDQESKQKEVDRVAETLKYNPKKPHRYGKG